MEMLLVSFEANTSTSWVEMRWVNSMELMFTDSTGHMSESFTKTWWSTSTSAILEASAILEIQVTPDIPATLAIAAPLTMVIPTFFTSFYVEAVANPALNPVRFAIWALRAKAAHCRLALR